MLWSAGIALTGTAGITQISALLALVLQQREQAVFQRLREWYLDAQQKSGKKRQELDVVSCFAPLLRWIVRLWEPGNRQMALVLDATHLSLFCQIRVQEAKRQGVTYSTSLDRRSEALRLRPVKPLQWPLSWMSMARSPRSSPDLTEEG